MQALNAKRMARGLAKLGDDYDSDAESEGVSDVGDDEAQWQTIIEDNAVNIMENTDGRNATGNARVGDEGKGSAESTDGTGNLGKDEGTDDAGAGLEMKVGSRVARGPDWQADFSDEDGRKLLVRTGDRALGTVTILVTHTSDPNARSVRVNWDLTGDPVEGRLYRFGADVREVVLEADAPEVLDPLQHASIPLTPVMRTTPHLYRKLYPGSDGRVSFVCNMSRGPRSPGQK